METESRNSDGTFGKGNPGKPKGAKSARGKQWEALGESIRETHTERFNLALTKMEDEDFCEMYLKVLEYFKPKLSRSEVKADVTQKHQPMAMSQEEYKRLLTDPTTDIA